MFYKEILTSRGRIGRSEFFFKLLLNITLSAFFYFLADLAYFSGLFNGVYYIKCISNFSYVTLLLFSFQVLSLSMRRLHDLNCSGWYAFLIYLPYAGFIFIFFLASKEGTNVINRYGEPI